MEVVVVSLSTSPPTGDGHWQQAVPSTQTPKEQKRERKQRKVQETINMDHKMFQDLGVLQRINYNMENIKIPKIERHHPLLQGLSHGERCYMFSIISVYDPTPARRRLYHKHKVLCNKALSHYKR